ncbi:hypothetical protein [Arsenophonus endosymbiont of Aphis craccivora]|uniref:hypothetical protein n=1 Tax=Arsenophonus endosymbiont of Aphis craccivora TaxID=1231049 RepID=UPI0015DE8901|nr:hypothetical protein [Arsenophonus endosymbiont of Aphis craccivora]
MTWGPDVETNLAISSANHLKVRFIQQSHKVTKYSPTVHKSLYLTLRKSHFLIKIFKN